MSNKTWHTSKVRHDLEAAKAIAANLLSNGIEVKFKDLAKAESSDGASLTCRICILNTHLIADCNSDLIELFQQ